MCVRATEAEREKSVRAAFSPSLRPSAAQLSLTPSIARLTFLAQNGDSGGFLSRNQNCSIAASRLHRIAAFASQLCSFGYCCGGGPVHTLTLAHGLLLSSVGRGRRPSWEGAPTAASPFEIDNIHTRRRVLLKTEEGGLGDRSFSTSSTIVPWELLDP